MKILKIELQNINSLRSDTPIIIDFEAEQFKDVGLYVITGSTGAGKTTILDAITIALYHQVPRFNASNVKASIKDVVSYGANDAFSRVLFENKNERFEAYYGIRLAAKNGKKLTNPQEEVQLKNLSTNKIIAEKKREVQTEVERVTQLDYNQFLRSVMLAQGEFASFLSAKGSEKGKLLEQITGEEIYKKIGEAVGQKQQGERKKLEVIKSQINSEDLLSNEQVESLNAEQDINLRESTLLDKKLTLTDKIIKWYDNNRKFEKQKEGLQIQLEELENDKKKSEHIFECLKSNDEAEPFKESIKSVERIGNESGIKSNELNQIEKEFTKLIPLIDELDKETLILKDDFTSKETDFKNWLPKLDKVSTIDNKIENEKNNGTKTNVGLAELNKSVLELEKNIHKQNDSKKEKEIQVIEIESFVSKHKNVPDIEKHLAAWSSDLAILNEKKAVIESETTAFESKEIEIKRVKDNLDKGNKKLSEKSETQLKIEGELSDLISKLLIKKLDILLPQKNTLEIQKSKWDALQNISDVYIKNAEELDDISHQVILLEKKDTELKTQLSGHISEIEKSKSSIKDSEEIVLLESKIKSFEQERQKLEEGYPCNLCGSTNHPFVEKYRNQKVTSSEVKLVEKKLALEKLTNTKNLIDKQLTETITRKSNLLERNNQLVDENNGMKIKAEKLNLACDISLHDEISNKLNGFKIKIDKLQEEVVLGQKLQIQKEEKEEELNLQKEEVNNIKSKIEQLKERLSNNRQELSVKKNILEKWQVEIEELQKQFISSLSPFQLTIPSIADSKKFINKLTSEISIFNVRNKELVSLQNDISEIIIQHSNLKNQVNEKNNEIEKLKTLIENIKSNMSILSTERNDLLPIDVTVEYKRKSVQQSKDEVETKLKIAIEKGHEFDTQKSSKRALELSITKDLDASKIELDKLKATLNQQIDESSFGTIEDVISALLSKQAKDEYAEVKKKIDNKVIELDTLKVKLEADITTQEKEKNFEISEQDAQSELAQLNADKENIIKRSGEIKQQFETNNQIKMRNKGVFDAIETQESVLKKWSDLLSLLGGSKDAFNTYVQRLTLQNLIEYANVHLFKLNRRYSLKMKDTYKSGEELNFNLIDHYQTDEIRYIDTSSGGEKFLISLALALGLSDLASNNVQIDSLFIDEGFGTLDNNTLETVISTLETLQAQGKMIGIISHVENLKERIPTQIQVTKRSNGVSKVEVV